MIVLSSSLGLPFVGTPAASRPEHEVRKQSSPPYEDGVSDGWFSFALKVFQKS
jgi:hypothetical protein